MNCTFLSEGVELPAIDEAKVIGWIKSVAATYGKQIGDITYIFCNDEEI